jgi:hypothetical protein
MLGIPMLAGYRYREQARSHRGYVVKGEYMNTHNPMWERACSR